LPGTKTLAYFSEASVSKKKGFIRVGKYHNRVAKVEGGEGESNIEPVANIRAYSVAPFMEMEKQFLLH
jgi:hypothetical protein